jgi:uncharacterized membrane protein
MKSKLNLNDFLFGFLIFFPVILTLVIYPNLPEEIYSFSKQMIIFFVLIPNIVLLLLVNIMPRLDFRVMANEDHRRLFSLFKWTTLLSILSFQLVILLPGLVDRFTFSIVNGVFLICGVTFLIFGYNLPKINQNRTLGIRTKWTLDNEDVWKNTHRFAGITWLAGGFMFLILLFITNIKIFVSLLIICFILIFAPVYYSYINYKNIVLK